MASVSNSSSIQTSAQRLDNALTTYKNTELGKKEEQALSAAQKSFESGNHTEKQIAGMLKTSPFPAEATGSFCFAMRGWKTNPSAGSSDTKDLLDKSYKVISLCWEKANCDEYKTVRKSMNAFKDTIQRELPAKKLLEGEHQQAREGLEKLKLVHKAVILQYFDETITAPSQDRMFSPPSSRQVSHSLSKGQNSSLYSYAEAFNDAFSDYVSSDLGKMETTLFQELEEEFLRFDFDLNTVKSNLKDLLPQDLQKIMKKKFREWKTKSTATNTPQEKDYTKLYEQVTKIDVKQLKEVYEQRTRSFLYDKVKKTYTRLVKQVKNSTGKDIEKVKKQADGLTYSKMVLEAIKDAEN